MLLLEQTYIEGAAPSSCAIQYQLHNQSDHNLNAPILNLTSQILVMPDTQIVGAELIQQDGNTIWLQKSEKRHVLHAGDVWSVEITGLPTKLVNHSDGVLDAVIWVDNQPLPLTISKLRNPKADKLDQNLSPKPHATATRATVLDVPICPYPQLVNVQGRCRCDALSISDSEKFHPILNVVSELYHRLYPDAPPIFMRHQQPDNNTSSGMVVRELHITQRPGFEPAHYQLDFTAGAVQLTASDHEGLHYGLISLAQLVHVSRPQTANSHATDAIQNLNWPEHGSLSDGPRFGWRGLHFDVSRHFFGGKAVANLLDVAAWLKLNRFHWHLTDDEGWRLPSQRYPTLNTIGSWRGPNMEVAAQYSHLSCRYGGFYERGEIASIVSHARGLHIEILPEIDLPGHCKSFLAAFPELQDQPSQGGNAVSVQGYINNALNPANEAIYPLLESIISEIVDLFPFSYFHLGGDEVADSSWAQTSIAQQVMRERGICNTLGLQDYFISRMQSILSQFGKQMALWDEAADCPSLDMSKSLIFAWRSKAKVQDLLARGCQIIATPGDAYYLDMCQSDLWEDRGLSWAGISSPQHCYEYEPPILSNNGRAKVLGVQAALWTERVPDLHHINMMAFPRLYAIAETGWTALEQKSWPRFQAIAPMLPRLNADLEC